MGKNRIEVIIGGVTYALLSEDEPDYIRKVAALVDDKMREIDSAHSCLTSSKKAVLTAINLADDFLKRNARVRETLSENEQLKKRIKELEGRLNKR